MIKELELFIFTFLVVYIFYLVFVLLRKNVLKKFPNSISAIYLKNRYNVVITDKNLKKIANAVFLANSLILSITVSIVCYFKSFILGLLVCIVPLILMILVFYHIIGIMFKGGKKNV